MLYFITSNQNKIFLAKKNLEPLGIEIETKPFEIPEIQSDNDAEIAMKKAVDAYALLQKPLFVSDDSWYITALRGFPGAYMKYVNQWLTPDDFLRLIAPYHNKEVILRQTLCFTDGKETKVFSQDNKGIFLEEPHGAGHPILQIVSFTEDETSFATCVEENRNPIDNTNLWKEFGQWYLSRGQAR